MKDIVLGQKVKDKVTDLKGITTGKCEYLNGCVQYLVTPKGQDSKGKWIDRQQLKVIKGGITINKEDTGGGFRSHPE